MPGQTFLAFAASFASRVLHLRLGETSGTAAADAEGTNTGTYTGGYTLNQASGLTGDANPSVLLNGSTGYVAVPDAAALDTGDVFALFGRVKRTRTSHSTYEIVRSKESGSLVLLFETDNTILVAKHSTGLIVTGTVAVADTNWHSLMVTKTGATLKLYLDGADITGAVTNQTITNTAGPLHLGAESASPAQHLGAYLDEWVEFNAALTASDAADLHALAAGGPLTVGTASLGTTGSTTQDLSWAPATGGRTAYSYRVWQAPDVAGSPGTFAAVMTATGSTSQTVTGLTTGTKYHWRVVVTDAEGTPQTDTSNPVTATTTGSTPPFTLPLSFTTLAADGGAPATIGRTLPELVAAHASAVFHARFNETSGTVANLAVGTPGGVYENVTLNQPGGLTGHPGNASVYTEGTTSRAWFSDRAALDLTTLTVWVRVRPTRFTNLAYQALWSKGPPSYAARIAPDNRVVVGVPGAGQFVASANPLPAIDQWYSIGWQYNGTSVNRLTIDGADVSASPAYVTGFTVNALGLAFGANSEGTAEWFRGYFDEAVVFNAAVANGVLTDLHNLATLGPLTAPAVAVAGTTATTVDLSWPAATGGTAPYTYRVQRSPDAGGSPGTWTSLGAGPQSGLTYQDTGRTASTVYHYRVVVTDSEAVAQTANSASVMATTGATGDVTAPVVTVNAASGITATSAVVNLTTDEAANVWVEWGTASGDYAAGPGAWTATLLTTHAVAVGGLPPNTVVHYRVRGRDAANNVSSYSADQTLTTPAVTPLDTDPPVITVGPTVSARAATDPTATITFTTNVPCWPAVLWGGTAPTVDGAYANVQAVEHVPANLATSHSVTFTLVEGVANHWAVAVATEAEVERVVPGAATITRTAVAPVVTGVSVAPGPNSAVVTWTTNEATVLDAVDYGLTTAYGQTAQVTGNFPAGSGHSVTVPSLAPDTTYQARALSVDAASATSTPVTFVFTTQAAAPVPPVAPSNLTISVVSSTRVDLAWQDNSTTEVGFVVERATGAGAFALITGLGPGVVSYPDASLTPGTTYTWRVRAINGAGSSAYTNTAGATTPAGTLPAAPSGLVVANAAAGVVRLTWADTANNETGYEVERATAGATGPYTRVAILGPDAGAWDDGAVAPGATYWWRVRAVNAVGSGAYGNVATIMTPPAPEPPPPNVAEAEVALQVYVDWGNDGSFDGPYDDVTDDVLATAPVTAVRGRDQVRSLAPPMAGAASSTLDNDSRRYSPQNTASPLSGLLLPGCRVRYVAERPGATDPYAATVLADAPLGYWRLGDAP